MGEDDPCYLSESFFFLNTVKSPGFSFLYSSGLPTFKIRKLKLNTLKTAS